MDLPPALSELASKKHLAYALVVRSGSKAYGINVKGSDYDYVGVFVNRTVASNNNFGVQWNMVAPHTAASTRFPTLPVGALDYNPDADDVVDPTSVALMKFPGGYDAIRANAFKFEDMLDIGIFYDVIATAGVATGSAALVIWIEPLAFARTTDRVDVLRHRARR